MKNDQLHQGRCKECGGSFWESYPGARGVDLCDNCETKPPRKQNQRSIKTAPDGFLPLRLNAPT